MFKALLSVTAIAVSGLFSPLLADDLPSLTSPCADSTITPEAVRSMITSEAERQGADVKLALALAQHESGFGAHLNSPMGARGIMQLMPATADQYGVRDICDAQDNIRGGIAYLNDLTRRFHGQIMLIAAAYNAGEARVINARGIPPVTETVNYTALVTNTYFGFGDLIGPQAAGTTSSINPEPSSVDQMVVGSTPAESAPQPINPSPRPASADEGTNTWLGGSVLYVQQ